MMQRTTQYKNGPSVTFRCEVQTAASGMTGTTAKAGTSGKGEAGRLESASTRRQKLGLWGDRGHTGGGGGEGRVVAPFLLISLYFSLPFSFPFLGLLPLFFPLTLYEMRHINPPPPKKKSEKET